MSDRLARQALSLLSSNIRTVCADGSNQEARSQVLLGSMLAGMAFANAPVAAVHALAYPIGAIFHVPHGLSNALVLTQVLRLNLPAMGPFGQMVGPLVAGGMPANGFTAGQIMLTVGASAIVGAAFVVWFRTLAVRCESSVAITAAAATVV
jgi:hypothetical protein